ncbi:hypothetical protein LVJ94_14405 [Pendulispora rubella]|uniref:Ferritin-like domain-containing protein n=1 Tax=Pendulispora rubella TaxID=2741070 RepID=A0ABZ2LBY7_9BACT
MAISWLGFGFLQATLFIGACVAFTRAKRQATAFRFAFPHVASTLLLIFGALGFGLTVTITALMTIGSIIGGAIPHGRPLRIGRRQITSNVRTTGEWAYGLPPDTSKLDDATKEALTVLWLRDAKAEHASVPAFARVAWQLAALGAPPGLIARAHQSALDEIHHAKRSFALASGYARRPFGPGPMPDLAGGMGKLPRDRMQALIAVANETLIDGAFLESCNAELARAALSGARDPAVWEILDCIARDEAAHAALAWDILSFCIDGGDTPVVRALCRTAKSIGLARPAPYGPDEIGLVRSADPEALRMHGRLDPDTWLRVYAECRSAVVLRLEHLLTTHNTNSNRRAMSEAQGRSDSHSSQPGTSSG